MSNIGYYRKKIKPASAGTLTATFVRDGVDSGTKTIRVKKMCAGYKVLKYLNKNGQYRVYPFERTFVFSNKPESIGQTNELITSILTAQTNSKNIGFRNERTFDLIAVSVPADELVLLSDLVTSPRVYLYVGDGTTDLQKDWVEVEISNATEIIENTNKKFNDFTITVKLPENFNVTML
jgi:hypothetical protein